MFFCCISLEQISFLSFYQERLRKAQHINIWGKEGTMGDVVLGFGFNSWQILVRRQCQTCGHLLRPTFKRLTPLSSGTRLILIYVATWLGEDSWACQFIQHSCIMPFIFPRTRKLCLGWKALLHHIHRVAKCYCILLCESVQSVDTCSLLALD